MFFSSDITFFVFLLSFLANFKLGLLCFNELLPFAYVLVIFKLI